MRSERRLRWAPRRVVLAALAAPQEVQVLRVVWLCLVWWLERGVFYHAARCDVPADWNGPPTSVREVGQALTQTFRVLVLSDPQVIGVGTYASYSRIMTALAQFVSDQYVRKVWLALSRRGLGASIAQGPRSADLVVLLGDLTDRGRWFTDQADWHKLQQRWVNLWTGLQVLRRANDLPLRPKSSDAAWPAVVVPGNHDIGLPDARTGQPTRENELAAGWFLRDFAPIADADFTLATDAIGAASWNARIPISVDSETGAPTHELLLLNGLDLVSMEPLGTSWADGDAWAQAAARLPLTARFIDTLSTQTNTTGMSWRLPSTAAYPFHTCAAGASRNRALVQCAVAHGPARRHTRVTPRRRARRRYSAGRRCCAHVSESCGRPSVAVCARRHPACTCVFGR